MRVSKNKIENVIRSIKLQVNNIGEIPNFVSFIKSDNDSWAIVRYAGDKETEALEGLELFNITEIVNEYIEGKINMSRAIEQAYAVINA